MSTPTGGVLGQAVTWFEKAKAWFTANLWPWALANPKPALGVAALAGVGGLLYLGGSIVTNGLIAGILISGGIGVLIWKLKASESRLTRQAYNLMVKNPLTTDIVITVVALSISPGGITGWIAAAIAGLIASIWLAGAEPVELPETIVVEGPVIEMQPTAAAVRS